MTPSSPPRRRRYLAAARAGFIALTIFGALAACSSAGGTSESSAVAPAADNAYKGEAGGAAPPAAVEAQPGADPQRPAEPNAPTDSGKQAPTQIEPQQRSLIYTGAMSVKVKDVTAASNRAIGVATGMGGAVGGDRRTLDADRSEAQLVLRVPSDKFNDALTELGELGTELTRSVQTQDVTEAIVDLESRLVTQHASVDRVRALLARAQTIGEVVSVESELTRREADLDSLEQRKAKLAGLVALSTITLDLRGPAAPTPNGEEPDSGFLAGLKEGWSAFVASIQVVLVVAGWLLPWIVVLGLPAWLIVWLLRRRRAARPGPTPPAPDEPATAAS